MTSHKQLLTGTKMVRQEQRHSYGVPGVHVHATKPHGRSPDVCPWTRVTTFVRLPDVLRRGGGRQKRGPKRGDGRNVRLEWAEGADARQARGTVRGRASSLRKRLQDGVHLLCHGCQRKLELLLRREKRCETAGEEGEKAFRDIISG